MCKPSHGSPLRNSTSPRAACCSRVPSAMRPSSCGAISLNSGRLARKVCTLMGVDGKGATSEQHAALGRQSPYYVPRPADDKGAPSEGGTGAPSGDVTPETDATTALRQTQERSHPERDALLTAR